MSTITGTYGYVLEDLVEARVAAWNWVGMSQYSEANEAVDADSGELNALARTVPQAPDMPTEGEDTSETQLQVDWTDVVGNKNGNSEVTSYSLWWDNGDSGVEPETELVNDLVFTYTITGLVAGSYRFKVRAHNIYGPGEWSDIATIRASFVPDVVATMTVTLNSPDEGLQTYDFAWTEPATGSETIDMYEIRIYSPTTGLYVEDQDVCDGTDPDVVAARLCQVDIYYLITVFGYEYDTLPKV